MGSFTNKLKLYKPGGGSTGLITPPEQVDIDKINANMDIIDAAYGAVFVTSGTHPASPIDGMLIHETDTQNSLFWSDDASRWVPVGIPNISSDAQRGNYFPSPIQGTLINRVDKGYREQYYGLFNATTNPRGWRTAGWFPELTGRTLIPLTSSLVTLQTGGTLTFQPGGSVDFVDVTTDLQIDNLFWDGMFQEVEFQLELTSCEASADVLIRARSGGVSDASGRYTYGRWEISAGANTAVQSSGNNVIMVGRTGTGGASVKFQCKQWGKATAKSYTWGVSQDWDGYERMVGGEIGGSPAAWDGLLISCHTSTGDTKKFSGRLTTYGLFSG
jgi:hypothetical protein